MQPKKYFIFLGLLFLSILLVDSFAKKTEKTTVTDARQLKGIWEALYTYQETARQERINTHIPPLPKRKEFESGQEYKNRINNIKGIYTRRVEKNLKREISNEQEFKNTVFTLRFTYNPYITTQDSMRQYLSESNGGSQESFKPGIEYSDREYKIRDDTVGQTNIKKSQTIDVNTEENSEYREKNRVLRKKIGSAGIDTAAAGYSSVLRQTAFAFLRIPFFPFAVPPLAEWRIEENNFSLQEDIAHLTFSLGTYNMEEKKFPVILSLSQFALGEKELLYYTKTLTNWKHYTETFKQASAEETEQWLIRFDELPAYIFLPLDEAKIARRNEKDLNLELVFQPVYAQKMGNSNNTNYILEVKLVSVMLKDVDKIIYKLVESNQ
jgi:hypothetical protein